MPLRCSKLCKPRPPLLKRNTSINKSPTFRHGHGSCHRLRPNHMGIKMALLSCQLTDWRHLQQTFVSQQWTSITTPIRPWTDKNLHPQSGAKSKSSLKALQNLNKVIQTPNWSGFRTPGARKSPQIPASLLTRSINSNQSLTALSMTKGGHWS